MAKTTGLESIATGGQSKRFMVDPRLIKIRPSWNFRDFSDPDNAAHVEDLYRSIKLVGVKEDLTVTWEKGEVWLDNGECRLRAALLVIDRDKIDIKVPVKSEERYSNDIERLYNQRIRNSGKPFSVFEDAAFFKRMLDMGQSQQDIADKCNVSAARVSQILEYNTVGKVGRDMVANGQASASLVMEVTKNEGTEAEKVLLAGLKAAKKDGKVKLKPEHVEGSVKISLKKVMIDAMEYADVDDTAETEVVIRMPMEQWDKVREAFKL